MSMMLCLRSSFFNSARCVIVSCPLSSVGVGRLCGAEDDDEAVLAFPELPPPLLLLLDALLLEVSRPGVVSKSFFGL